MTVKELKEKLKDIPDDYVVFRESDEYKDAIRPVLYIDIYIKAALGRYKNSVVLV